MNYLIGAIKHRERVEINTWIESAIKYCKCQVVLIVLDRVIPKSLVELEHLGIRVVHSPTSDQVDTNICKWERHFETRKFLKTLSEDDLVLLTDTIDVVFQKDPFEWFVKNANKDLILTSEGITHKNEPWNKKAIETDHSEFYEELENKEIINSGTIIGKSKQVADILLHMYVATRKHNFESADQPALNVVLLSFLLSNNIEVINSDNGLAIHCGVAGPSEVFHEWGFAKNYKYGLPVMESGEIINQKTREVFCLVHQYNRVAAWGAFFTNLYKN